jgi:hypothetical protein
VDGDDYGPRHRQAELPPISRTLVLTLRPTDSRGRKLIRDFAISAMRQNAGVRCAAAPEVVRGESS